MMKKRHSLALGLLSLVQGACVTPPPLERPPWQGNAAGSEAWTGKLGLATLYSAGSDLRIESQPGSDSPIDPIVEELETDMIGRFGMGFGYQRFLAEDFALSLGVEGRFTATEVVDPPLAPPYVDPDDPSTSISGTSLFEPGDVFQIQASDGGRYWLPVQWGQQGRLRPFVGADLNYIPATNFDVVTTILDNPATGVSLQDSFEFKGSDYWTIGLCMGLSYQWSDELVVSFTLFHETALNESLSLNTINVQLPPPSPPDLVPPLSSTTTVDAGGWIGFLTLSWGF